MRISLTGRNLHRVHVVLILVNFSCLFLFSVCTKGFHVYDNYVTILHTIIKFLLARKNKPVKHGRKRVPMMHCASTSFQLLSLLPFSLPPPSLPPSSSLPPSLPPPFFPPSLPPSLLPSLPPSLPSSLPSSLPPYLPTSSLPP